jgi:hypothetical protein
MEAADIGQYFFGLIEGRASLDHDETLKHRFLGRFHMMLANLFYRPSRVLAGCLLLGLSGCANEVLDHQLATSREAVDQAKMAGAAETAPAEFDVAVNKLNRANAAAKEHHEKDATRLAQQAQVDANLARVKTDSTQARIAAAEVTKSNRILRDTINRANQNQ